MKILGFEVLPNGIQTQMKIVNLTYDITHLPYGEIKDLTFRIPAKYGHTIEYRVFETNTLTGFHEKRLSYSTYNASGKPWFPHGTIHPYKSLKEILTAIRALRNNDNEVVKYIVNGIQKPMTEEVRDEATRVLLDILVPRPLQKVSTLFR